MDIPPAEETRRPWPEDGIQVVARRSPPRKVERGSEKKVDSLFELVLKAKIKKNHEEWR
jgi:hypothetical protein